MNLFSSCYLYFQMSILKSSSNQQKIAMLKQLLRQANSPLKHNRFQQQQSLLHQKLQKKNVVPLLPLQQRYFQLEEKINIRFQEQWRSYQSLLLELQALQQQSRSIKRSGDRAKEIIQQKIISTERQLQQEVSDQIEQIKSIRKELIESIEKKYKAIKTETMVILGSQFQNGIQEARQEITVKLQQIKRSIQHQEAARDEIVTFMVSRFGQEILNAEQMVQKQREERIDRHRKLMASLVNIQQQIGNAIAVEKRQSNSAIHGLESFLEELCFKIQNHILR